jgi:ribosomal protein L11 methyltransferase
MNRIEQIIIELNEIEIRMNMGPTRVTYKPVQEEDWANAWKVYFKPERIGKKTVIKPSWEEYTAQEGDLIIEIDPGMAFGTGNHATTALCLQMLEEYVQPGMDIIDVGTGSGILAIQTALLGAGTVQAMDFDTVAVSAAKENVALNNLGSTVSVCQSDLLAEAKGEADIIVANIIADIIIRLTPSTIAHLKGPKVFISSGIIDTRKDDVLAALKENGFSIIEVREDKGWVAIAARYEG